MRAALTQNSRIYADYLNATPRRCLKFQHDVLPAHDAPDSQIECILTAFPLYAKSRSHGGDMTDRWTPDLTRFGKPHYKAIADAIAHDMREGRLRVSDRLPPQRDLAERLGINFTTVARGYVEAQKRGLIESRTGQGTFVAGQPRRSHPAMRPSVADLTMNLPPEPEDRALADRMQAGLVRIARDLPTLLRYQGFGGTYVQREAAAHLLAWRGLIATQERLAICPGTHLAFQAILQSLLQPGEMLMCEALTYPGIKAVAGRLGLRLIGLPIDDEGIEPDALDAACRDHGARVLYMNPTLLNPTTSTCSQPRREALIEVARRHGVTIIEDDAYGLLPRNPPRFCHAGARDHVVCGQPVEMHRGRFAHRLCRRAGSTVPVAGQRHLAHGVGDGLAVGHSALHAMDRGWHRRQVIHAVRRSALPVKILPQKPCRRAPT
jgi:DNA-binding transcriptional regulator YhcF (GntR family)